MATKHKLIRELDTADGHKARITERKNLKLTVPLQYWIEVYDKDDGGLIYSTCHGRSPNGLLEFVEECTKEKNAKLIL
jgi:hypothetical protein